MAAIINVEWQSDFVDATQGKKAKQKTSQQLSVLSSLVDSIHQNNLQ